MKKLYTVLLCILLFMLATAGACSAAPASQPLKYAFVEKVIDTYTLEVSIGRKLYTVRLLGLAPLDGLKPDTLLKLSDLKADTFVANHVYNTFVYLEVDAQEKDYDDRLLAYVWLNKPEKRDDKEIRANMLNAKLLLEGYGQWALAIPNYKYTSALRSYGEEAQKKRIGIWAKR